ncbi:MAG TPA: GMC family oxidoreductase N-terminal domain-containing protein [Rhizomicrobium sp.]|nr:GMC family oxidoreductase N-terminal domain-containing protein [Rhizomicrobium sp.]
MLNGENSFDYVIAGAGTAGCVLANRLSEDPKNRVCLIEAGPKDSHPFIHVPALVAAALSLKSLSWGLDTVPQPSLNGRRIPIPRGRVLGGSSSVNGMVYFRGHPRDYDDWAAAGNHGWGFADVLPYFIRSENNTAFRASPWHGATGPMYVSNIRNPNPLNTVFADAMSSLQFRHCEDFNGQEPEGYGLRQGAIRGGRRESGVTAFLKPAMKRSNLTVVTDARIARVVVDNHRASGVDVLNGDGTQRIEARREVILAGGAVGSPQMLLLSGIGDGASLQKLGIAVKHHLPSVGANYHDHVAANVQMWTTNAQSYGISLKALPRGAWNVLQYLVARQGPFASNVFESHALLRSTAGLDRPDIQVVFQPARRNQGPFPLPLGHGFAISIVLLHPKSRGRLTLATPDPRALPLIDPALLSAPEDTSPLVRGLKLARRVFASPAFAPYEATEFLPGPSVTSDVALEDYVRATAATVHHLAGTCRMGADGDAVVTPELKVKGVDALRVADASIFPKLMGGNTNAPVVMVAEKAADMILGKAPPAPLHLPTLN